MTGARYSFPYGPLAGCSIVRPNCSKKTSSIPLHRLLAQLLQEVRKWRRTAHDAGGPWASQRHHTTCKPVASQMILEEGSEHIANVLAVKDINEEAAVELVFGGQSQRLGPPPSYSLSTGVTRKEIATLGRKILWRLEPTIQAKSKAVDVRQHGLVRERKGHHLGAPERALS